MQTALDQMITSLATSRLNFKLSYNRDSSGYVENTEQYVLSVWEPEQNLRRRPKLVMRYDKNGNPA